MFTAGSVSGRSARRYLLSHWHWFWDMVNKKDEDGTTMINLVKCPTDEMQSDYLTKPLGKILFANNRKKVQGW